jgi:ankyrin repeat protein
MKDEILEVLLPPPKIEPNPVADD